MSEPHASLPEERGRRIERRLAATFDAVDAFCAELREAFLLQIPHRDRFAVELLLREALTNAVQYGAACDPRAGVCCEIELLERAIALRVSDSGNGFDWRRYVEYPSASLSESGRGIQILCRYASSLRFNEKGNSVEAVREFGQEEGHGRF